MCAKAIINSGINKIIYDESYRELRGIELLEDAGIEVRKFTNVLNN